MRLVVDIDVCAAHGECVIEAPEIFDLGEDDRTVTILIAEPPPELEAKARKAMGACPVSAIYIDD